MMNNATISGLDSGNERRIVKIDSGGHLLTKNSSKLTIVTITTTVTLSVGANTARLHGILISRTLNGTCLVNGFVDSGGAGQTITFDASSAPGFYSFEGAINESGNLTLLVSNALDDNSVSAFWSFV